MIEKREKQRKYSSASSTLSWSSDSSFDGSFSLESPRSSRLPSHVGHQPHQKHLSHEVSGPSGTRSNHQGTHLASVESRKRASSISSATSSSGGGCRDSTRGPLYPYVHCYAKPTLQSQYVAKMKTASGNDLTIHTSMELGKGAFCRVYQGILTSREGKATVVAVKCLKGKGNTLRRMRLETQALSLADHQTIVRLLDKGLTEDGSHTIIMELVPCGTLKSLLRRLNKTGKKLTCRVITAIAYDVLRALDHLHSRNIKHLDIKLDNITITAEGNIKLLDFGLARVEAERPMSASSYGTRSPNPTPMSNPPPGHQQHPYRHYHSQYSSSFQRPSNSQQQRQSPVGSPNGSPRGGSLHPGSNNSTANTNVHTHIANVPTTVSSRPSPTASPNSTAPHHHPSSTNRISSPVSSPNSSPATTPRNNLSDSQTISPCLAPSESGRGSPGHRDVSTASPTIAEGACSNQPRMPIVGFPGRVSPPTTTSSTHHSASTQSLFARPSAGVSSSNGASSTPEHASGAPQTAGGNPGEEGGPRSGHASPSPSPTPGNITPPLNRNMAGRVGTPSYMPPEVFASFSGQKSDVWAAGVLLYQLWTMNNQKPFDKLDEKRDRPRQFPDECKVPQEWEELILNLMLEPTYDRRPTARELLNHRVFKGMV